MSNHIRDTKEWQKYLQSLKRKAAEKNDDFLDPPYSKFKSLSCKNILFARGGAGAGYSPDIYRKMMTMRKDSLSSRASYL